MDKDFMQFVYSRIEKALTEDPKYMNLQSKLYELGHENTEYENTSLELDVRAQELCYIRGFKDALNLLR